MNGTAWNERMTKEVWDGRGMVETLSHKLEILCRAYQSGKNRFLILFAVVVVGRLIPNANGTCGATLYIGNGKQSACLTRIYSTWDAQNRGSGSTGSNFRAMHLNLEPIFKENVSVSGSWPFWLVLYDRKCSFHRSNRCHHHRRRRRLHRLFVVSSHPCPHSVLYCTSV